MNIQDRWLEKLTLVLMTLLIMVFIAPLFAQDKPKKLIHTTCTSCRYQYNQCVKFVKHEKLTDEEDEVECENQYADCFNQHRCFLEGSR